MNTTTVHDGTRHTVPTLPRSAWRDHPHYETQALLLGSHENFLDVSRHLVERAAEGAPLRSLAGLYRRWIAAMRSHEAYEEGKLYPYLERRFGLSLAEAEAGHEALHAAHDDVTLAFDTKGDIDDEGTPVATEAVHAALRHHDEVLIDHLTLEEDLVIPPLLALRPVEFAEYYSHSLDWLLARLDQREALAGNAEDREAGEKEEHHG